MGLNFERLETELRKCQVERLEEEVRNQRWQGSLVTTSQQNEKLSANGCFWWLTEWKSCLTHRIAGITRLYVSQKTHTSLEAKRGVGCVIRPQKVWFTHHITDTTQL